MNIKKSILLTAIVLIVAASTGGAMYVFSTSEGKIVPKGPIIHNELYYFGSDIPNDLYMKPGQTQQIPVDIMGPLDKPLVFQAGVTSQGKEAQMMLQHEQNLPSGISVVLAKTSYNLPPTSNTGIAKRDSNSITITVAADTKPGNYPLSFVLYMVSGKTAQDVRQFLTIHVQ